MTLGQEFSRVRGDARRGSPTGSPRPSQLLHEINLGATAIGTGLNAPAGYAETARRHLGDITGLPLVTAVDLVEATQDCGAFVHLSGVLKRVAVKLSKICNDLRLLSSGPRAGLGEIKLPPVQAGSSIMPGKVNPVIPEVVNQVAFEVIGNDVTITMAAEAGQLQLNAFEPIILHSLSESITHLRAALPDARRALRRRDHGQHRGTARRASRTPSAWSPRSTRTSAIPLPPTSRRKPSTTGRGVARTHPGEGPAARRPACRAAEPGKDAGVRTGSATGVRDEAALPG